MMGGSTYLFFKSWSVQVFTTGERGHCSVMYSGGGHDGNFRNVILHLALNKLKGGNSVHLCDNSEARYIG